MSSATLLSSPVPLKNPSLRFSSTSSTLFNGRLLRNHLPCPLRSPAVSLRCCASSSAIDRVRVLNPVVEMDGFGSLGLMTSVLLVGIQHLKRAGGRFSLYKVQGARCKASESMISLSTITPQISRKSSSAMKTRRTYAICASKKSPIDNGGYNHIGAGDAVIIVDHGSRRWESNLMLNGFVAMFRDKTGYPIVEPAHMELAEPSIRDSFASCVAQGAKRIIVSPFFLFPGRHWQQDIPSLTAEAAKDHPGISYIITAPLGLHEQLVDVVNDRINHCLSHAAGVAEECEVCAGTGKCKFN